jgi:hypothetical protein
MTHRYRINRTTRLSKLRLGWTMLDFISAEESPRVPKSRWITHRAAAARVGRIIPSRFSLVCARARSMLTPCLSSRCSTRRFVRLITFIKRHRSRSRANYTWTDLSASLISTDIGDRVVIYPADNVFTVFIIVASQTIRSWRQYVLPQRTPNES